MNESLNSMRKVLVVDDDSAVRTSIVHFLEDADYEVAEASDGREGLRLIHALDPDLILLDLRMPEMDGFSVLEKLQNHPRKIPVIIISGTGDISDAARALHLGAWDYIVKPVPDLEILRHSMTRVLNEAAVIKEREDYRRRLETEVAQRTEALQNANIALARSKEHYQLLAENQNDVVLALSGRGVVEYCSPAITRFGGYSVDDVIGTPFAQYFSRSEDIDEATHRVAEMREDLKPQIMQFLFKPFRGNPFWVEVSMSPVTENSLMTGLHAVLRDISVRKNVEKSLLLHRQALEQSVDGIAITDLHGEIAVVNRAWATLYRLDRDECLGRNIRDLLLPESGTASPGKLMQMFDKALTQHGVFRHRTVDGETISCRVSCSEICNSENESIGYVWISRDVTREIEIQERLRQAEKMESIGRLAGGIAHDFNNLLTPILGYSEFLMEGMNPDAPSYHDLLEIKQAALTARDLVGQLLAFSRKQVLHLEIVDLNGILLEFKSMIRRTIRENIAIHYDISREPCLIRADKTQIHQILMNLTLNAQDAMPGGGMLTLTTAQVTGMPPSDETGDGPESRRMIRLAVRDTGMGMSKTVKERIFEPFYTTKEVGRGTGLGLAMVQGIVDQHFGFIQVESVQGKGTEIEIFFPVSSGVAVRTGAAPDVFTTELLTLPDIILVEDDSTIRTMIERIFRERDQPCVTCISPEEALTHLRESSRFGCLITDVILPGMSGIDLAQKVRELHPAMKVMFISGYSRDALDRAGLAHSDVLILQKPFLVSEFLQRVRDLFGDRAAEG